MKKLLGRSNGIGSLANKNSEIIETGQTMELIPGDLVQLMNSLGLRTGITAIVLGTTIEDVSDMAGGFIVPPSKNYPDPRKVVRVMTSDHTVHNMLASFVIKLENKGDEHFKESINIELNKLRGDINGF